MNRPLKLVGTRLGVFPVKRMRDGQIYSVLDAL